MEPHSQAGCVSYWVNLSYLTSGVETQEVAPIAMWLPHLTLGAVRTGGLQLTRDLSSASSASIPLLKTGVSLSGEHSKVFTPQSVFLVLIRPYLWMWPGHNGPT